MFSSYKDIDAYSNHEEVVSFENPSTGLRGYVAIHSTHNGKALGGTRMFAYASEQEALRDALRLSRAMSYKCAIARLPFGGGKGVIIADPDTQKTPELLKSYAEEINKLGGKFYTGEDVGISEWDVKQMLQTGPYFIGKSDQAGDPSNYAALSAFECLKTALKFKYGSDSLEGITVAVKGVGKTGSEMVRLILEAGGSVVASETNSDRAEAFQEKHPEVKMVDPRAIYQVGAQVFAPCALGDDLSVENIEQMRFEIICGTANNQLDREESGDFLFERGVIYVPDYLANAGGLINVACELEPEGFNRQLVLKRITELKDTCYQVLDQSSREHAATNRVANAVAQKYMDQFRIKTRN